MSSQMDAAIEALKTAVALASDNARDQVLHSLNQLIVSIEQPIDALNRLAGVQLGAAVAKIAAESGLYKALADVQDPVSAEHLASKISAAPSFTSHLLRYLAANGHVNEIGVNQFAPNSKTKAFALDPWVGGIQHYFESIAPAIQVFPAFMKDHEYQDIDDSAKTAFQVAHNTKLSAFDWLPSAGQNMQWFMQFMQVQRQGYADWLSVFPVEEEVGNWKPGNNGDDVLFVDVGGAFGHQAISFNQRYGHLPGRVILQDVPPVVKMAQLPAPIEKIPINFFEGQPIKGAKFYYLRNIMHDHPDARCSVILKHIKDVMGPESVILIDEMCFPAKGGAILASTLDLIMMSCLAAVERTMEQWTTLLDSVGLKIKSSHKYTIAASDTVIVAVPK